MKVHALYSARWGVLVTGLVAIPVMEEADAKVTRIHNEIKKTEDLAGGVINT